MNEILIDTTSYDTIVESIANICNCNNEDIENYIMTKSSDIAIDDINLELFFRFLGVEFGNYEELYEKIKFNVCTISHISSRISLTSNLDIYSFSDLFFQNTELNQFLLKNNITFRKNEEFIDVYCNGKILNFKNDERAVAKRLFNRFTIKGKYSDNCINGFLLNDYCWEDGNVQQLRRHPEFLEDLASFLKEYSLIHDWDNISKSYIIQFKANIDDLIIDNYSSINSCKDKVFEIYRYVIYFLVKKYHNKWDVENDNVIMRLKENLNVKKENIFNYYEFNREYV